MTINKTKKTAKAAKKTGPKAKVKPEVEAETPAEEVKPIEEISVKELDNSIQSVSTGDKVESEEVPEPAIDRLKEYVDKKDTLQVKKIDPAAKLPVRAHPTDAGVDIFCLESFTLGKGERKSVRTGIAVSVPAGYYGRLAEKGGLANGKGLQVLAGVVDENYIGEVLAILFNPRGYVKGHAGSKVFDGVIRFEAGDKICQLVLEKISLAEVVEVEELEETDRGEGSFGSTGSR